MAALPSTCYLIHKIRDAGHETDPAASRSGSIDFPGKQCCCATAAGRDAALSPVEGTWLSNWGPVTFVPQLQADGIHIRGFLQQWPSQKGTITDGHYDAAERKLTYTSFQEWNSALVNATLTLSPDGKTLTGTWQSGKRGGPTTMQFLFRGDPPKASEARPHNMPLSNKPRLEVLPVLFIARDANWITESDIDLYSYLIFKHLELAQRYYKNQLGTDTFKIADEPVFVYRAQYDDAHYLAGHTNEKRSPAARKCSGAKSCWPGTRTATRPTRST